MVGIKNIRNFISNYFPENTYILNLDYDLSSIDFLETPKKLSKFKGLDKFILLFILLMNSISLL